MEERDISNDIFVFTLCAIGAYFFFMAAPYITTIILLLWLYSYLSLRKSEKDRITKLKNQKIEKEMQKAINEKLDKELIEILSSKNDTYFLKLFETIEINHMQNNSIYERAAKSNHILEQYKNAPKVLKDIINENHKEIERSLNIIEIINKIKNIEEFIPVHTYSLDIDKLKGVDFEKLIERHFSLLDRKVEVVGGANDYGVDVVVHPSSTQKGMIIQCKRYKETSKVSSSALQKIRGATFLKEYADYQPYIITTSYLTKNAHEYARQAGVFSIERDELISKLKKTVLKPDNNKIVKGLFNLRTDISVTDFLKSDYYKIISNDFNSLKSLLLEAECNKEEIEEKEMIREFNRKKFARRW